MSVAIQRLDHVNLWTTNLAELIDFYGRILDLAPGPRPSFSFEGAWLYCGDQPVVHLVRVESQPKADDPRITHFAFSARGLSDFIARLRENEVPFRMVEVPGFKLRQVNFHDPDGNHIHVDFTPDEPWPADVPYQAR